MKRIGIVLVAVGIAAFVAANMAKDQNRVFSERFTDEAPHQLSVEVEAGSAYTLFFWGRDEETGMPTNWAGMELQLKVVDVDGQKVLLDKKLTASASSAEETGGVKRAQNGEELQYIAPKSGNLSVLVHLLSGDEVTVDVYKNLPTILNLAPGLAIILLVVGVVLFLKGRAKAQAN